MKIEIGNYYKLDEFIFKVEEFHLLEDRAGYLVKFSDWIGKFPSNTLGNFIEITFNQLIKIKTVDFHDLAEAESKAVVNVVDLMQSNDAFMLPIKRTPERELLWRVLGEYHKRYRNV